MPTLNFYFNITSIVILNTSFTENVSAKHNSHVLYGMKMMWL
jgi:hypothetical protein